jgi:ribokinase
VVRLTVVGSVNLDLVARCERLPRPGETIGGATFERIPGGKGANQALAARRLGAEVTLVACVGSDEFSDEALATLREEGVELLLQRTDTATGTASITVAGDGENTIVVAPGANSELKTPDAALLDVDAILMQLEIPLAVVEAVAAAANETFVCLNASPVPPRARLPNVDLTIANRQELEALELPGDVVITLGAEGAVWLCGGEEVGSATPPPVEVVDGTAAGDAFAACLVVSLLEGSDREEALRRACTAGALAASKFGAQPSLPTAPEIDALLAR